MSDRPALPGGPYLVVGLARSGIAAALLLHARGEQVIAVDAGAPDAERLRAAGVEVHLDAVGTDLVSRARALVKSPGVPHSAPAVRAAREHGLPVLGEVELAWSLLPNEFVAVTGTNGKTTTTELLGHVHRTAGLPVAVAGNVGTAVASLVGTLDPAATVVCESSSYQLEDTLAFAPEAALLLNVTPDHLDRHGTFEAYRDAKLEAFRRQTAGDVAVTSVELAPLLPGAARRITFGTAADGATIAVHGDGAITWEGAPLIHSDEIGIRGPHNRENAMAAAAVALARGIDRDAVREALRTFAGVAHRLEPIRTLAGVAYVNDSKATNVDATQVALRSFPPHSVHLIAGGVPKAQDFSPLAPLVAERCAAVYLIGEGAQEIAAALEPSGVPMFDARDMAGALAAARAASQPGEVVLLSPACASFDQYANFEERGDHFRRLVEEA